MQNGAQALSAGANGRQADRPTLPITRSQRFRARAICLDTCRDRLSAGSPVVAVNAKPRCHRWACAPLSSSKCSLSLPLPLSLSLSHTHTLAWQSTFLISIPTAINTFIIKINHPSAEGADQARRSLEPRRAKKGPRSTTNRDKAII